MAKRTKKKKSDKKYITRNDIGAGKVFLLALIMSFLIFLPFLVKDGGRFLYYGDYLLQQIPFYTVAHEAVRSGNLFLNFTTDLGSSLYSSYSFYLLGSPFFWITIPFPKEMLPSVMPWLLMLKMALSAMFAYLYIKRYTKKSESAVMGSILYAFSGFVVTSIVFNHFLDVIAFFPLYLIFLEDLVEQKKRGRFALFTAFMAILNYYFFIAEVLFLILYVISKYVMGGRNIKELLPIWVEGIMGVLISGFFFVPSMLSVVENQRVSQTISGSGIFIYDKLKIYGAILKSMFLPGDLVATPTVFSDYNISVSSLSLFLPLFAISGVIAFFYRTKKEENSYFMKRLLVICLVFALIPGLNALFSGANAAYYARWMFMPILIMATATVVAVENFDTKAFSIGVVVNVVATVICIGVYFFVTMTKNRDVYKKQMMVAVICLVIFVYLIYVLKKDAKQQYIKGFLGATIVCALMVTYVFVSVGYQLVTPRDRALYEMQVLDSTEMEALKEKNFIRAEVERTEVNDTMMWGIPSVSSFISTIPGSAFEFYDFVGVTRKVMTILPKNKVGLRSLLSTKYLLLNKVNQPVSNVKEEEPIKGYKKVGEKVEFEIYKSYNALSMGCVFDSYMKLSEYKKLNKTQRDKVLMFALVFADDKIPKNTGLTELTAEEFKRNQTTIEQQAKKQNQKAATAFEATDRKITLKVKKEQEGLLFLSIPYSTGFKVTVDNKEGKVLKADQGLMAVSLPKGSRKVVFTYEEPGLKVGMICSVVGVLMLAAWVLYDKKRGKKDERA